MFPELADTKELSSVLAVLSAMITPTVMILACGSLITTTSSRAMRCNDRVRERAEELDKLGKGSTDAGTENIRQHLYTQLDINMRRARLLQRALGCLYFAMSFFVATSGSIGIVALLHVEVGWIPLVLGFFGAALLFSASVYLLFEVRLANATTATEMDYISRTYMASRHR